MRKLLYLLLTLTALWSGYWFVGYTMIHRQVEAAFADAASQGMVAEKTGLTVAGFPNRWDVTLDGLRLADPKSGLAWSAPFAQIFAMTWKPWHIIAGLAPTQTVSLPDQTVTVSSTDLMASFRASPSLDLPLAEVRAAGTTLNLASDKGWTLGLGEFSLGLRADPALGPSGYEFGFDLAPLTPDPAFTAALKAVTIPDLAASDLPDTIDALTGQIFLTFSAPLDRNAGAARPNLTKVDITQLTLAWGKLAATAKGLIQADDQGFAAGEVTVDVTNWDRLPAILVAAGAVKPDVAPTVARGMQVLAAQSPDKTVLSLTLKLADGRMSFGPFPLGPAPRMIPPGS